MLHERRRMTRLKASRIGSLILPGTRIWKECLVWEYAEAQAVVWVDFTSRLPSSLILSIASIRFARACRVVWSEGHIHGLEFIPSTRRPSAIRAPSDALPAKLSMLRRRITLPHPCERARR